MSRLMRFVLGSCIDLAHDAANAARLRDGLLRFRLTVWVPAKAKGNPLLSFQRRYFEPWTDTPPQIPTLIDFLVLGTPLVDFDAEFSRYAKENCTREAELAQRLLSQDPSLQPAEVTSAISRIVLDLNEGKGERVRDILDVAELLWTVLLDKALVFNTKVLREALAGAIRRVTESERSVEELVWDSWFCSSWDLLGSSSGIDKDDWIY